MTVEAASATDPDSKAWHEEEVKIVFDDVTRGELEHSEGMKAGKKEI